MEIVETLQLLAKKLCNEKKFYQAGRVYMAIDVIIDEALDDVFEKYQINHNLKQQGK